MTVVYTVVVFYVLGTTGLALVGIGAGVATVAGLLAAFHTRRLLRRHPSVAQPDRNRRVVA